MPTTNKLPDGWEYVNDHALPEGWEYTDEPPKPQPDTGDTHRGWNVGWGQMAPLFEGAVGLVGATAEKALGDGGISTAVKNWGLNGYQEGMAKLQPLQHETDDVTVAWKKAKEGDIGALVDWAQYSMGYGMAQLGAAAGTGIISGIVGGAMTGGAGVAPAAAGGMVGKQAAQGAIKKLIESAIAKRAETAMAPEIAKLVATGATEDAAKIAVAQQFGVQATKAATKSLAQDIGAFTGLTAYSTGQEAGTIYATAEEEAKKKGESLTGSDIARIWGSATVAGVSETIPDLIGWGAFTGRIKIPGGMAGRAVKGALGGVALESGQEGFQTGVERFGANQPMWDDAAKNDYINSMAMAALPGAGAGLVAGAMGKTPNPQPITPPLITLDEVTGLNSSPDQTTTPSDTTPPPTITSAPDANSAIAAFNSSVSTGVGVLERKIGLIDQQQSQEDLDAFIRSEQFDIQHRRALLPEERQKQADMALPTPAEPDAIPIGSFGVSMQEAMARKQQQDEAGTAAAKEAERAAFRAKMERQIQERQARKNGTNIPAAPANAATDSGAALPVWNGLPVQPGDAPIPATGLAGNPLVGNGVAPAGAQPESVAAGVPAQQPARPGGEAVEITPPEFDMLGDPIVQPTQTTQTDRPIVPFPVANVSAQQGVDQFKKGADSKGLVEDSKLPDQPYDDRIAAPIQLWERLDGTYQIISGRHRLDLAQRNKRETIPAQIYREADGFTADQARMLDIELNVKDGRGKVVDYVKYFKEFGFSTEQATKEGLLNTLVGRQAHTIADAGSESLIAAHANDAISDRAAVEIARAAPNNEKLQAVGIQAVMEGKSDAAVANLVKAVSVLSEGQPDTLDMFGFDSSGLKQAKAMAKFVAAKQSEAGKHLAAISGAAKSPDIASRYGVDVKNPKALSAKIEELKANKAAWDRWQTNPELIAQIKAGIEGRVAQPEQPYTLKSQSSAGLRDRQAGIDAASKEEARLKAEQDKQEKQRREHENIKQRSEGAAKTFELGQDAETNLSGQSSLFQAAIRNAETSSKTAENVKPEAKPSNILPVAEIKSTTLVTLKKNGEILKGVDAQDAMAAYNQDVEKYQSLLDCMRAG